MTPGLHRFLIDVRERDIIGLGITLEPSNDRATAVRLGLLKGRQMKVGHRKIYSLTSKGLIAANTGRIRRDI